MRRRFLHEGCLEPGKPSGLSRGTPKPSSEHADGKILLLCPKPVNAHLWCSCAGPRDKWNLPFNTGQCNPTPGVVSLTFAIFRRRIRKPASARRLSMNIEMRDPAFEG